MARQFRCPRPINRLIPMRSRGLSGPFMQNIGGGFCVHTPGAYINAFGGESIELIGQFLVPDPDHVMTGVLLGEGDLTVSRAATVDVPDGEGVDQTFGTAEPAWGGGRVTGAVGSRVVYDTDALGVEYADPTWLAVAAGDSHTLDSANLNDYQGSLYVEVWMNGDDNILNGFLYRESGDGGQLLTLDDGTTQVTAAMSDDEWHEVGVAWSTLDAKMDLFFDGSWIGEVAYDGSMLSGALDLFRDAANGGKMRNLRIYSDGSSPSYDFDLFVNSLYGDDGNTGTVYNNAFATLSAAEAAALSIGNGVKIGLAFGSEWREELDLSSLDNVTIAGYGASADGLPVVRGDDVITGDWDDSTDRADAYTNTYSLSWTHTIGAGQQAGGPQVWEDDTALTWRDTIALVDANPGSFYHDGATSDESPVTLYVHPLSSTNPNSDGKVYEATKRNYCLHIGDGATVRLVRGQRQGHDNGSIYGGDDCLIDRCMMVDGTVHNGLLASGEFRNCVGWTTYDDSRIGFINLEFYSASASGKTGTYTECIGIVPDGSLNTVFGGHTAGVDVYDQISVVDSLAVNGGFSFNHIGSLEITRTKFVEAPIYCGVDTGAATLTDVWLHATSNIGLRPIRFEKDGAGPFVIDGLRAYYADDISGSSFINTTKQIQITLNRSVISIPASTTTGDVITNVNGGTATINGCVINVDGSVNNVYGADIYGLTNCDNNVYWPGGFRDPKMAQNGTQYDTIALYFTGVRPTHEANSVVANPQIADPANGDFALNGSGLPAACGLERPNITYLDTPATLEAAETWIFSQ